MKIPSLSPWPKLLFALLLLATTFLSVPPDAYAVCCGHWYLFEHYADPGHTQFCGSCITDCDGIYTCAPGAEECPYIVYRTSCCACG